MNERKLTRLDALAQLTAPGQAYELEDVDVYGYPCRAFKKAPATLRALYFESRSDVSFFVYEEERYTYEEVYQRSCQIATLLVDDYGIRKGDRVSISMRNYPEWVMAFNAVTSIGAIAVAMNALWLTGEMEYGLDNSGTSVLFADQERVDRVLPIYHQLGIKVIGVRTNKPLPDDIARLEDLLSKIPVCEMPSVQIDPDDDVTILYTSGSTGHPKGVVSSHRNIINALLSWELDGLAAMLVMNLEPQPPAYPHHESPDP